MHDIHGQVRQLQRPGLLVRAARFGIDTYRRDRDLARLLPEHAPQGPGAALMLLLEEERAVNAARLAQEAHYALVRHIDLLSAIMAEARDLAAVSRPRTVT